MDVSEKHEIKTRCMVAEGGRKIYLESNCRISEPIGREGFDNIDDVIYPFSNERVSDCVQRSGKSP